MGATHFSGPVDSAAGFTVNGNPTNIGTFAKVDTSAATLTLDPTLHGANIVTLSRAAGTTVTLPAATGSGVIYRLLVLVAVTSNNDIIKVANASDTMIGFSSGSTFAGTGAFIEGVGGTDDTCTMNGSTTGGLIGSYIILQDFATNVWFVDARLVGSGTMATSFSATV